MSDLLTRLRDEAEFYAEECSDHSTAIACLEAAAEIERLRKNQCQTPEICAEAKEFFKSSTKCDGTNPGPDCDEACIHQCKNSPDMRKEPDHG